MDFSSVKTIYDPLQKKSIKRWVLELPGAGCEWYKKTGGCTMCGFNQSTYKYTFGGKLYPHFLFMLLFYYAYLVIRKTKPELLVIYNSGSFLSDKEIPLKTQLAILKFVRNHSTIKKIMVEGSDFHLVNGAVEQSLEFIVFLVILVLSTGDILLDLVKCTGSFFLFIFHGPDLFRLHQFILVLEQGFIYLRESFPRASDVIEPLAELDELVEGVFHLECKRLQRVGHPVQLAYVGFVFLDQFLEQADVSLVDF